MGAGRRVVGAGDRGHGACGSFKKIWAVWPVAFGYSPAPGRSTPMDRPAGRAAAWKHHLCGAGYDRAKAARLDVRVLERHAHGVPFFWNCQRQQSWRDLHLWLVVRAWTVG